MFGRDHYVPILKGREGEYGALQTLAPSTRQALTPLIEIPPIPWDFEEERPAKTVDQHLKKVGQKIDRAWGSGGRLFVDLLWIPDSECMADGSHPLSHVFQLLRTRQVAAVPVVGLLRGDEYLQACRTIIDQDDRGLCVRIQREDFADFGDIGDTVRGILDTVGTTVQDSDLIFDLRALPHDPNLGVDAVIDFVNRLADGTLAAPSGGLHLGSGFDGLRALRPAGGIAERSQPAQAWPPQPPSPLGRAQ
jgi:hypothetical protein